MQRWKDKDKQGKIILITATVLMWLLLLLSFRWYGYEETWRLWKVPTASPIFMDFRLIPGSAESFREGYEPAIVNPKDPRDRILNYPAFWRLFFYTGITQADTVWISILMLILFFISVLVFPDRLSGMDAGVLLLVVFSPASMLLYERGNVDLIVFSLCVLVVLALDYHALAATGLLMFATVVKVFPFFGVLVLLREARARFIWLATSCFIVLTVYAVVTFKSMSAAWNQTMRGAETSYGSNVLFLRYGQFFSETVGLSTTSSLYKYGPILLAILLIVIAGLISVRSAQPLRSASGRNLAAFRMGAGIYVGTFLLGNNWDYRLAFLILVVPQLMEWVRAMNSGTGRRMAVITLISLLLACWHFILWFSPALKEIREIVFGLDELTNWILMIGLAYLLAGSAPEWIRDPRRSARVHRETH